MRTFGGICSLAVKVTGVAIGYFVKGGKERRN